MKKFIGTLNRTTFIALLLFVLFGTPLVSYAVWYPGQPIVPCGNADLSQPKCDFNGVVILMGNVVDMGVWLAPVVAAVAFAIAGILYITSAGDPGKLKRAHDIFFYTLVGLVIVLAAWLGIKAILTGLGAGARFDLLGR